MGAPVPARLIIFLFQHVNHHDDATILSSLEQPSAQLHLRLLQPVEQRIAGGRHPGSGRKAPTSPQSRFVRLQLLFPGRLLQLLLSASVATLHFQSLFTINPCQHPIVILKDVKFLDLKVMVDFMYYGEVNVSQEQLPYILKTAEMLKIKGN